MSRGNVQLVEPFERVLEHMPVDGEPSLVVLKAHLLIEEQLWAVIADRFGLHEELLARFKRQFQSSRDVALIAEAMVSVDEMAFHDAEWVWAAIEKMNSLRNRLAHDLEPVGVSDKMKDFVDCVASSEELIEPRIDFYFAAWKVCEALSKLRKPIDPSDFDNAP